MEFKYDPDANAATIRISEQTGPGPVHTVSVGNPVIEDALAEINLDFDSFGQLLTIEVLDAKSQLPPSLLRP